MNKYLFRISLAKKDAWSTGKPRPVYFVARSKEDAVLWAEQNIKGGLIVSKITRLAVQVGGEVFTGVI